MSDEQLGKSWIEMNSPDRRRGYSRGDSSPRGTSYFSPRGSNYRYSTAWGKEKEDNEGRRSNIQRGSPSYRGNTRGDERSCHICKQLGHIARFCPKNNNNNNNNNSNNNNSNNNKYNSNKNYNSKIKKNEYDKIDLNISDGTTSKYEKFVKLALKKETSSLCKCIKDIGEDWNKIWEAACNGSFEFKTIESLAEILGKISNSYDLKPPPFELCIKVLKLILKKENEDYLNVVRMIMNVINNMLSFTWRNDKEYLREELKDILEKGGKKLNFKNNSHREVLKTIDNLSESLDRPWSILTISDHEEGDDNEEGTGWKNSNVRWLVNAKYFVPELLPKMKNIQNAQKDTAYLSSEKYFSDIHSLMIGMTWYEGWSNFNLHCKVRGDNGKNCGRYFRPIKSNQLSGKNCFICRKINQEKLDYSCSKRNHQHMSICKSCYAIKQKELLKKSTNVYDGVVDSFSWERKLSLKGITCRRPPENGIHWKTTYRIAVPNLVGIIKLDAKNGEILPSYNIYWGEICSTDRNKFEISVMLYDFYDYINIRSGDHIAIIDCITFAPEYIPVLLAIEDQQKYGLPFDDGKLLNISNNNFTKSEYLEIISTLKNIYEIDIQRRINIKEIDVRRQAYINNINNLIKEVISKSNLVPIQQIREDPEKLMELLDELSLLVVRDSLDKGQLESFLSALLFEVHCTQGPPGTGKSYLGVTLTCALFIIQKIWCSLFPNVRKPPILIMAYKNHAVDEFLSDLITKKLSQFNDMKVVRLGRSQEYNLRFYTDFYEIKDSLGVNSHSRTLKRIHSIKDACLELSHLQRDFIFEKSNNFSILLTKAIL